MNLNQLKYIIEIAKTGSINHAAANLFISQSVLSTAVSRLEKEIGQTNFLPQQSRYHLDSVRAHVRLLRHVGYRRSWNSLTR